MVLSSLTSYDYIREFMVLSSLAYYAMHKLFHKISFQTALVHQRIVV